MPARLCFGQLSITGKDNRVCANTTHAQAGMHLVTDVFSPYPDINLILTLIHIFSRVLKSNKTSKKKDVIIKSIYLENYGKIVVFFSFLKK